MQNKIPKALITCLREKEYFLKSLNKEITKDTNFSITYDYEYVIKYLELYNRNYIKINKKNLKPKGKILIILSYNEPFVMSIVPVMNALIAGNDVTIKPSGKTLKFFKSIWIDSGIKDNFNLNLTIFEREKEELNNLIPRMNAVYFFGGYENAKKLASRCAETLVEFYPEVEAADCKVVYLRNASDEDIRNDIKITIKDSFLHTGQNCQRIQGIFVNKKYYEKYTKLLQIEINKLIENKEIEKYIPKDYEPNNILIKILKEQLGSDKNKIIKSDTRSGFPYLIYSPSLNGEFIKSAQFLPTLWISSYEKIDTLIDTLNSRRYKLGINISCTKKEIIEEIINSTKFSRYTTNTPHAFVRYDEGWGGVSPTGYNGYKSWIENFSYPYTVISD